LISSKGGDWDVVPLVTLLDSAIKNLQREEKG